MTDRSIPISWLVWLLVVIGAVWVAVLMISLFSPDLVSGSQQEHLPLVALTAWVAGVISTGTAMSSMRELRDASPRSWVAFGAAVIVVWAAAILVSLTVPELVTGGDPTRLPLASLIAPFGAAALTWLVGTVVAEFGEGIDR